MTNGIYFYYDTKHQYTVYIGKDNDILNKKRHHDHLKPSNKKDQPFNAILQANPNRYEYGEIIIGNYSEQELNEMERYFIRLFKTHRDSYPDRNVWNFKLGGEGGPHSIKTKEKLSKMFLGKNSNHCQWDKIDAVGGINFIKNRAMLNESMQDIGNKIGVSRGTIQRYLNHYNIKYSDLKPNNHFSQKTKDNLAMQANTTGFFRVSYNKIKNRYYYRWTGKNSQRKSLSKKSIPELKKVVLENHLERRELSE